ncbi:formylglycine-generating enzyme family protein [Niveibacterium sp. 24ML]|uniref:formylglycine-generating enzyme family protein n=1 Tax=Niveibacterium sp. 24ML TaxID=2985512 RepID=UPI00226F3232|nr:SUMF1/EgtB/PvdO family nonheme iron enzyme [Niveibacterium sp. 24ML]MCX9158619.1 formylglycine-generating enzyme family protein [Niveibacterium sp. 24ML]
MTSIQPRWSVVLVLVGFCSTGSQAAPADSLCPQPLSIAGASCPDATLHTVKPPAIPRSTPFHISEKKLDALPVPQQAPELAKTLASLEHGSIEERVARLKAKAIKDLIFVKGGTFTMGDFTPLMKIPDVTRMTYNEDDKHLHDVTLSDFYLSRYKATYAELNVFADATGRPRLAKDEEPKDRHPSVPAGMYWQTAQDFCQWLGTITSHSFDLPTEAQWEYAARSRGQFFMIPTDDGHIDYGRNVPYAAQAERLKRGGFNRRYPIGLFPPNPLGMYDMQYNGQEWVRDWYAADTYERCTAQDPKGPTAGARKVVRGWAYGDSLKIGVSVWRRTYLPDGRIKESPADETYFDVQMPSVRCVATP